MVSNSEIKVVHVRLLDEPVPVWRPVLAEQVKGDTYLILKQDVPEFEIWEYVPGQIVLTESALSDGEPYLRARSAMTSV